MPDFNFFLNGQSRGKDDQSAFYSLVNCDIHSEPGRVRSQYALAADDTSGVPTETCVQAVTPAGTIYYFSTSSGKIWKRSAAGAFSSITANANTTGHRGARYYNGKVYYWTASKLGEFVAETEASKNNSKGTFSNGNAYGSCEENLTLYICDGKYVASINSNDTFQANALDLPAQFIGTCIIPDGATNILIGTIIGGNVHECRAFIWDTYSDSFSLSDLIPERGINTFISCDEFILAQCGLNGHLYQWTGGQMVLFDNELRDETTALGHQLSCVLNGKPLIAVGTKIYSIYKRYATMPRALVREYTATAAITSLEVSGEFLSISVAGGVNKIGTSRATAEIETPEIKGQATNLVVDYADGGDEISLSTNVNGVGYVSQTAIQDSINNQVYFDGGLPQCNFIQGKVTFTGDAVLTNISIQ